MTLASSSIKHQCFETAHISRPNNVVNVSADVFTDYS